LARTMPHLGLPSQKKNRPTCRILRRLGKVNPCRDRTLARERHIRSRGPIATPCAIWVYLEKRFALRIGFKLFWVSIGHESKPLI
jgi:hypothetical protein